MGPSVLPGVNLVSFLDTAPEFQAAPGAASALEAVSNRLYNDEARLPISIDVGLCSLTPL